MAIVYDKIKTKCSWCENIFTLRNGSQYGAFRLGSRVYCSTTCSNAAQNRRAVFAGKHLRGPCPMCGKMFHTRRREKIYCSVNCYLQSDQLQQHLKEQNKRKRRPLGECPQCGAAISHKKKYCSSTCRRQYFAARFDRWIANPETIALPQCYDEFLLQNELPCLVDGCEWVGKHLASHCNYTHGITADELKGMAGFNKTTGLVSIDLHDALSKRSQNTIAKMKEHGMCRSENFYNVTPHCSKPRLEGLEHAKKARALMKGIDATKPARPCRLCGKAVLQPLMGRKLYCSTRCRSAYYEKAGEAELRCDYCGENFIGNLSKVRRAQRGDKVCCSQSCRNQMNLIACFAVRGIEYTPS